jgi:hypothetical protein
MFGLADTPAVAGGRVKLLLHLLSPAGRPVQITRDLKQFWNTGNPQVKKELKGRYPKHPWPNAPWNAVPTKRQKGGSKKKIIECYVPRILKSNHILILSSATLNTPGMIISSHNVLTHFKVRRAGEDCLNSIKPSKDHPWKRKWKALGPLPQKEAYPQ